MKALGTRQSLTLFPDLIVKERYQWGQAGRPKVHSLHLPAHV